MQHKTIIRNDLTFAKYGYKIESLHSGSHNKIIVECTNCKQLIHREYRYKNKTHQCSITKENKKRCFKCKCWKLTEDFPKYSRGSGGVGKMCKTCHNSHPSVIRYEKERNETHKSIFNTDIHLYLKKRCYATKKQSVYKQVQFNLTPEYLIKLWESQQGKCYYSKLKMESHGKEFGWQRWNSPSLDRKDPDKGYTIGNVVWCCFGINSFKGRLNEEQFEKILQTINWWYEK